MLHFLKHSTQFHFLIIVVAVLVYLYSGRGKEPQKEDVHQEKTDPNGLGRLFTPEELELHDGSDENRPIYIAILGRVYDVDRGRKHYGPGGSYSFFAGRDATTAFISGDFETVTDDLDDVLKLPPRDVLGVWNWSKFYDKDYTFVGKLMGRYYDGLGEETEYLKMVSEEVRKEEENKARLEREKQEFPPCNTEWNESTGSTFWCSNRSGGIEREWVGVPRRVFKPGQTDFNCVCVQESELGGSKGSKLKEFDGCDPLSTKCAFDLDVK